MSDNEQECIQFSGSSKKAKKLEDMIPTFTHSEAMSTAQEMLAGLIVNDPLLRDLDPHVTLEEVNSMIALEYGQAMVVNVRRQDNEIVPIVVTQKARVIDLKHAVKRHFTLRQIRTGGSTHISWKYIWKRYWLSYNGEKLTDDNKKLKNYGIRNRDSVTFVKRLRER
ncbi:U11/U12 small nuclear ribonucleoprotein 25 kDa protein-like isoform X2 [Biomphalaria glabrata]|nr:U11/U12 small nuclear ribonucleoprotein 25 kDa protein-like isoform X2 [Biomphalaria glabrata]XP_055871967.1 U11/U12 small nuclear ribonucleoprotein 25 kDa protein-like isoform X2 [Biomphalaria glabrata]KAI8777017.1 U11/U12 small nuclear ribonucleoprotein 25 kDa protein [Biomphalaria glabrata]